MFGIAWWWKASLVTCQQRLEKKGWRKRDIWGRALQEDGTKAQKANFSKYKGEQESWWACSISEGEINEVIKRVGRAEYTDNFKDDFYTE